MGQKHLRPNQITWDLSAACDSGAEQGIRGEAYKEVTGMWKEPNCSCPASWLSRGIYIWARLQNAVGGCPWSDKAVFTTGSSGGLGASIKKTILCKQRQ